jgi:hypothetical protein
MPIICELSQLQWKAVVVFNYLGSEIVLLVSISRQVSSNWLHLALIEVPWLSAGSPASHNIGTDSQEYLVVFVSAV